MAIESPYAGDVERNVEYARRCVLDSLNRGELPFAAHLLYAHPRILDDSIPEDRAFGLAAGRAWFERVDAITVYVDLGVSSGMQAAIDQARFDGRVILYRSLDLVRTPFSEHGLACRQRQTAP